MKRTRFTLCIFASALTLLVTFGACNLTSTVGGSTPVPVPTLASRTQPAVARPALFVQYCDDDTGSYPSPYFAQANALMATTLKNSVTTNQGGVTLYATAITHNTFDARNTLAPFTIPAIPSYGVPPTPWPTHAAVNPVTDNATATAVEAETGKGIADYNATVAQVDQQLEGAKSAVNKDVKRLTSWKPQVDTIATSVLGCLQLAAERFQGQSGQKMLYIASDMRNNTEVDATQNFAKDHRLSGVIVHVIFFYSPTAAANEQKSTYWCRLLTSAGATTVLFSDPKMQFNGNLFDTDLAAAAQPCSQG